jgi:thiamine biosynthesis lipoprotein
VAEEAIREASEEIRNCDRVFSDYQQSSEISRLAVRNAGQPLPVSDDLLELLSEARQIHRSTGGAFDVTLGTLTGLWRKVRRNGTLPATATLQQARSLTGFRQVILDEQNGTIKFPVGMRFDFGGIAKGFAADRALACLRQQGITSALVELGGDMAVGEPPPGTTGWRIAVAPLQPGEVESRHVLISRCGVATSGYARQFVEIEGVRYSHIVDPATGLGLQRRSSVTVISGDATTADALASAYSVMSLPRARSHVAAMADTSFLVQDWRDEQLHEFVTPDFPPRQHDSRESPRTER